MDIEVDTRLVEAAAARAVAAAAALRVAARAAGAVPATVHEPAVASGVVALADVVADACEVVSLDLELVSRRLRAGAVGYAVVESTVAGAAGG